MAFLFSASGPPPSSFNGHFLLAAEDLVDPNFYKTALLMIQHDGEGALGVVINRPTQAPMGVVLPDLADSAVGKLPLFWGGPVQPELLFLLRESQGDQAGNVASIPGIVFEPLTPTSLDYLKNDWEALDASARPQIRLFAGYAGWGPLQLESEIQRRSWYWHPAEKSLVFHAPAARIWEDILSLKGPLFQLLAETGTLPSLN